MGAHKNECSIEGSAFVAAEAGAALLTRLEEAIASRQVILVEGE